MTHMLETRPIGIDLFAGAGGLSLGFEQAGFDVAAAVEIDPIHCAVHQYNFPHTHTLCASVTDLKGDHLRRVAQLGDRDIDVVFGGAPCQGFSMIGKRILDDPRNHLVGHFVRLVQELRPRYAVFENVRGLTQGQHVKFLQQLIAELAHAGYQVTLPYQVLNAADYGVPQDRRRLFLLAARHGQTPLHYPEPSLQRPTVMDAIGDLPDADGHAELQYTEAVACQWQTRAPYARILRGLQPDPADFSHPRRFDRDLLSASLRTEHTALSMSRFGLTAPGATEPVSRFRRLPPDGLCHTLRAGTDSARGAFTSPRPIHPLLPRVITVREAARLHSFPDWFRLHATKWHGFRQIGNSVPPLLGRAVAQSVAHALDYHPHLPTQTLELGPVELLNMDMSAAAAFFSVPHHTIAQRQRRRTTNPDQLELWGALP